MLRTHYSTDVRPQQQVKVAGWVDEKRDLGGLVFVLLRDGRGRIQITAKKGNSLAERFKKLGKEDVISVEGRAVENASAPNGIEIVPASLDVLASVTDIIPIEMNEKIQTNLDKRLDYRCLDLRREQSQAIFRIQSMLIQEIQEFLRREGFFQVFTPCIMGVASESGSDVFPVVYYDKEAFLRQDPQLHRQLTIAGGFERIYDVGPSWRAEPSHTTRHLCEHRTCAVEFAFIKDEHDVIQLEQEMVKSALKNLVKDCKTELDALNVKIDVPDKFPVLEFPKIYDILEELGFKVESGNDYDSEQEKALGDYVKEKYNSDFFFVNRFPFAKKPFYVMRFDDDPQWARSTDLIYRGVELSSGGQREHRYEKIIEQAKIKKMSPESVAWFADFFKWAAPPHGGFAIGIERMTKQLLGLENIREATLFPRDTNRLVP
ncbi:MAG: aspartate--tRNA(Asn) ligase [Candidatus Aenigmarchaeota archaeon]|nr:aspartate--tRNA(Asn) ligase [Candidatus Aenigmarchaeota archaeon]MDI6721918.1 aspartate--tRNA(Asn) ligase [Candidatus Aenigmarchaeota archaeon]